MEVTQVIFDKVNPVSYLSGRGEKDKANGDGANFIVFARGDDRSHPRTRDVTSLVASMANTVH